MHAQRPGYSINPGGRRKYTQGAKERMGEVAVEVVEFWIATMRDENEDTAQRMRASENLGWGYFGKPAQQVLAAVGHVAIEPPDDLKGADIERLTDVWAAMIGAREMPAPNGTHTIEAKPELQTATQPADDIDWGDDIADAPPARPSERISRRRK
jgi:hypothetical protein